MCGRVLESEPGVVVAVSDYMKALPDLIARWVPQRMVALGTDGFGRSDSRKALRDFFEVDARYIAAATLSGLAAEGVVESGVTEKAMAALGIDPEKPNPACT